jgi:catechol 2,3-dioxygenase-like lactoylglutathione lyase family enzyme
MPAIAYAHTNLIARDWRALAQFYIDVLGCTFVPPERDLSGEWIERMTGVPGVRVRGCHLRLPGPFAELPSGPTLEIFSFEPQGPARPRPIDGHGLGHLAFRVDDVEAVLAEVEAHGGSRYGELVQARYPELGLLTAVYARDPEGNVLEIQSWDE